MSLIGRGATGSIYKLNTFIAVKRARNGEDEQMDHANEQEMFKILEKHRPLPYLVRCYYQRPKDTFLEFAPNGCIATLLNQYQKRDGAQVLKVSQFLSLQNIHRWMKQLCFAVASLGKLGLTHGDIRPGNMLLDAEWNLKLSDFDRAIKIGEEVAVLTEPFGRLLNQEDCGCAGTYGKAGARTETFAIGSVYYTLLHGHEPYETETWGKDRFVTLSDKFQNKDFPPLSDSSRDVVIRRCWDGEYKMVRDLRSEFLGETGQDEGVVEDQQCLEIRKVECMAFIQNGLVDTLDRF